MAVLQFMSDLRLDFNSPDELPPIPVIAPTLALLGNVGYPSDPRFEEFLLHQASRFETVLVVAGRTEHYSGYPESYSLMDELCRKAEKKNIIFMNRKSVVIGDVKFIGTTLWPYVEKQFAETCESQLEDYKNIQVDDEDGSGKKHHMKVRDHNKWHKQEVSWLTDELISAKSSNQVVVVLTYHPPTARFIDASVKNPALRATQSSELDHLLGAPIAAWCFGHTDQQCDSTVNGTKLESNPLCMDVKKKSARLQSITHN